MHNRYWSYLCITLFFLVSAVAPTKADDLWSAVATYQDVQVVDKESMRQLQALQRSLSRSSPNNLASAQYIEFSADALAVQTIRTDVNSIGVTRRWVLIDGEEVLFLQKNDVTMAVLTSSDQRQHLVSYGSYGVLYDANDLLSLIPESDTRHPNQHHKSEDDEQSMTAPDTATADSDERVTIDLYTVYTAAAVDLYGADGVLVRISLLNEITNQIMRDSGVLIDVHLLAAEFADWDRENKVTARVALVEISDGDDLIAFNVDSLKRGADFVMIFKPFVDGDYACGVAWLPSHFDFTSPNTHYSHVAIDCADYVAAHELGHNLGLTHSRRQDFSGWIYDYGLGYGVDGEFATVMAYENEFQWADKQYVFASPELNCKGQPCGIDHRDESEGADAVRALNNIRFLAAERSSRVDRKEVLLLSRVFGTGRIRGEGVSCLGLGLCPDYLPRDQVITLTAEAPDSGVFAGWGGSCSGSQPTCELTLDRIHTVVAHFNPRTPYIDESIYRVLDVDSPSVLVAPFVFLPNSSLAQGRWNGQWQATTSSYVTGGSSLVSNFPGNLSNFALLNFDEYLFGLLRMYLGDARGVLSFWMKMEGDGQAVPINIINGFLTYNELFYYARYQPNFNTLEHAENIATDATIQALDEVEVIADGEWRKYEVDISESWAVPMDRIHFVDLSFKQSRHDDFENFFHVYLDGVEFEPTESEHLFAVRAEVSGDGYLRGNREELQCRYSCGTYAYAGVLIEIEAVPLADAEFIGWTGECAGQGRICRLSVTQHSSVEALFTGPEGQHYQQLADALDAPELSFSMRSGPIWQADRNHNVRGGSSVRVVAPNNNLFTFNGWSRYSGLQTSLQGPGRLTFAVKTDLQVLDAPDEWMSVLRLRVNSREVARFGGYSDWRDFDVELGEGVHHIEWLFEERSEILKWFDPDQQPEDQVWLDHLRWTGTTVPNLQQRQLDVNVQGRGRVSAVFGSCDSRCSFSFPGATEVTLVAERTQPNWQFSGWTGACEHSAPICRVSLSAVNQVTAVYASTSELPTYQVVFDLGERGLRVGGGELEQVVRWGQNAIAPDVEGRDDWHFAGWNSSYYQVSNDLVVRAIYRSKTDGVPVQIGHTRGGVSLLQPLQYVASGDTLTVQLAPLRGFTVRQDVSSDCPEGRWINSRVYQTGELYQGCQLYFYFVPEAPRRSNLLKFLLLDVMLEDN